MKIERVVFVKPVSIPGRLTKESLSEKEDRFICDIEYSQETGFVEIRAEKQKTILVPRENVAMLIPRAEPAKK